MPDKTDAVQALQAEATGTLITLTFRDRKFSIDPAEDWVMDFLHYTDRDKVTLALEVALGADQYTELRAMNPRPKLREYLQLLDQIGDRIGSGLGEA